MDDYNKNQKLKADDPARWKDTDNMPGLVKMTIPDAYGDCKPDLWTENKLEGKPFNGIPMAQEFFYRDILHVFN